MKIIVTTFFAVFLLSSSSFAGLKPNDTAPIFSLRDSAGNEFSLSDFIGAKSKENINGVVLSFFASWCIPCRNELPIVNPLSDELQGKGVKIVIVGVREGFASINALLVDLKVDKLTALSDQDGKVSELYQIRFLPVTFFIGGDGKIKHVLYGEIESAQTLRNRADDLVN